VAKALPWRLAAGNSSENLEKLRSLDAEPWELVTKKVWQLLKAGYNVHQLETGLSLLNDCPWTSNVTEQLHASAGTIKNTTLTMVKIR